MSVREEKERENHYCKLECNCQEITRFIFQFSFTSFATYTQTHITTVSNEWKDRIGNVFEQKSIQKQAQLFFITFRQFNKHIFRINGYSLEFVVYLSGGDTIIPRIYSAEENIMLFSVYLCSQHTNKFYFDIYYYYYEVKFRFQSVENFHEIKL